MIRLKDANRDLKLDNPPKVRVNPAATKFSQRHSFGATESI